MIDYLISDNGKIARLEVSYLSADIIEQLNESGTIEFTTEVGYNLYLHKSGINKLESDYGQTTIWVADVFTPQKVVLRGYVAEDRNNYYQRINDVMELANGGSV